MRNQHSDTRTMQAMHADLNCEPKGSPRWQAQEESQSPFRVVEATKIKEWGRDGKNNKNTNKQTNKNLPLPSALCKGNKWNSDQSYYHHHVVFLWTRSSWVIKLMWAACRKPQCNHQITADTSKQIQPSGHFKMNIPFQSPCYVLHCQSMQDTLAHLCHRCQYAP